MSVAVLRADARCLPLPDASVDLIMCSPPYFGLRSYTDGGEHYPGQIGSEATPAEWLANLVACTREWVRVLKPEGSIFVNLGDKYSTYESRPGNAATHEWAQKSQQASRYTLNAPAAYGTPYKSLLGLPWRYALACMDDLGLILRAEIVWSKPNGLPESVTDRVRRSHEQVFHFTRLPRYFSAVDEIREPHAPAPKGKHDPGTTNGFKYIRNEGISGVRPAPNPLGKLPGSVWDIPSQPLTVPASLGVDHFAAFPMELPRRVILGWSPAGVCTACAQGRRPVTVADDVPMKPWTMAQAPGRSWHGDGPIPKRTLGGSAADRNRLITGYACACPQPDAPTRPAVVVDPFGGTGTTGLVASVLGRHGIVFDLSADYCRLAAWRTTDPGERARAMQVPKPPPVVDGQAALFAL